MLMKPDAVRIWWDAIVDSGGRINEDHRLLAKHPTIVPKSVLRDAFHEWNDLQPNQCVPVKEREFGRIFKQVLPEAQVTRPRIDGTQIASMVLPNLS